MKRNAIFLLILVIPVIYLAPSLISQFAPEHNAEDYIRSGKGFAAEDNLWKAREAFRLAIKADPNNSEAYFLHGVTELSLRYYDDAISDFSHCLQLDPNNGNAYYNRGLALAQSGNLQGALGDFDRALKLNEGDVAAYRDRALVKQKLGDRLGALEDLNISVSLNPNYSSARVSYGMLLLELGKIDEGIEQLNSAVSLDPQLRKNFLESEEPCGPFWNEITEEVSYRPCSP
ncbi:tetratricopeptide repeat protein [bacterium]|nr:tetratricopeptide repeat protein [bacterium]